MTVEIFVVPSNQAERGHGSSKVLGKSQALSCLVAKRERLSLELIVNVAIVAALMNSLH
jgi:hypothetical protein